MAERQLFHGHQTSGRRVRKLLVLLVMMVQVVLGKHRA